MQNLQSRLSVVAVIITLTVAFSLIGCVHSEARSHNDTGGAHGPQYRFLGERGAIIIDASAEKIITPDGEYSLVDCSSNDYYCYRSPEIDFSLALPKNCKQAFGNDWKYNGIELVTVAMRPESDEASMLVTGSSKFMFDYSPSEGLRRISYDPEGRLFGADQKWSSIPYENLKKYKYVSSPDAAAFKCDFTN